MAQRDIIVVGASAGGVNALKTLIGALPADLAATVVVVLHIPAHSESQLHQILGRAAKLPVLPAVDGEPILRGHLYVAPADRHVLLERDRLRVTRGPRENRVRPAVDVLFRSAAYAYGPRVIGIVLTGMLDDGTAGSWAIKDRGGIVLVQSADDAEFSSMPDSTRENVQVDNSLPISAMAAFIMKSIQKPVVAAPGPTAKAMEIETRIGLEGNALQEGIMQLGPVSPNTCPECHGVLVKIENGPIVRYRCHTGHAFSLLTLLADVNDEIEKTLWAALRAAEERILLLNDMEELARVKGDGEAAEQCAEQVQGTKIHVERIREAVLDHRMFGHAPALSKRS
jgi:two-component system, chemotaxis family, protein-glutamate methylesterase/glutaminase